MRRMNNKMEDIKIAYIGGGSRGWAWNIMSDFALEDQLSGTIKLYDIDKQAALANEIIGNRISEAGNGQWQYEVSSTLEDSLKDVDFVIISILPGTFKEMYSDVHQPEKYGIYQSVGDTTGPGGLVRALRTIPMFEEIAEAIKKVSPDAWVINYTNPMALSVRTLYKVFPEIKAFGCCHEVFGTQKLLTKMLAEKKGIEDIDRREIDVNVIGLNHFTWLNRASYKDIDLMPLYKEFVEEYHQSGYTKGKDENWMNNSFTSCDRVKFDLFDQYGCIAAAGDRHLAEFVQPGYLENPEVIKSWGFGLTTVDSRIKGLQERLAKSKEMVDGGDVELKGSGEEGIDLIKALCGLGDFKANVNIPNRGQINNMPLGTIVETNAIFGYDTITPLMAGDIPTDINALLAPHVINQEMILEAAINKDKDLAFKAFCNDPLVTITTKEAKELFDTMLANTKEYLPGWDI